MLGVLLSFTAASAELVEVVLNSDPQNAVIRDQFGNEIGFTGSPFQVDLDRYGSTLEATLLLEGYEPKLERIKVRQLKQAGQFPEHGAIALRATSNWVAMSAALKSYWPVSLALVVLGLGGAGYAWRQRRSTRAQLGRATILESMRARAEETGDELLGQLLGGYRLEEQLGEGGTARVYRAIPDDSLSSEGAVAIKVLHPESEQDTDFLERFHREVNIWKTLSHPNIVTFMDWGQQDGLTYLVMELIEGGTLRSRYQDRPSPEQAVKLLKPVFSAVANAHSKGVVHRDLKPENVMLARDGRLKVTDFGLARTGSEDKLTKTGTWVGTPAYMAPEQIRGLGVDPKTDQYALGIMTYELLAGQTPFEGSDQVNVIFQQVSSKPPPLKEHRPELSDQLVSAVERMLAKSPEQRFPDLEQALAALEAACG